VFLTAIAVVDDLAAIAIIAIFYTNNLSLTALTLAGVGLIGLILLNRFGVRRYAACMLVGTLMWVSVVKSGVHATLARPSASLAPLRLSCGADWRNCRRG
jgi:NhaA family Na+:H+ antiporter